MECRAIPSASQERPRQPDQVHDRSEMSGDPRFGGVPDLGGHAETVTLGAVTLVTVTP
jgi:hypothetical protein